MVSTHLKIISQNGNLPQGWGWKFPKHIWVATTEIITTLLLFTHSYRALVTPKWYPTKNVAATTSWQVGNRNTWRSCLQDINKTRALAERDINHHQTTTTTTTTTTTSHQILPAPHTLTLLNDYQTHNQPCWKKRPRKRLDKASIYGLSWHVEWSFDEVNWPKTSWRMVYRTNITQI